MPFGPCGSCWRRWERHRGGDDVTEEHDRLEADGAAYVLGALDADDRAAFEQHLRACASCRRSVADLAPLPELLDRVPLDVIASLDDSFPDEPVPSPPARLLDDVLARAREAQHTARRRRRVRAGVVGAAAALVAAGLVVVLVLLPHRAPQVTDAPRADETVALTAVRPSAMAVDVALTAVPWGTRVTITCSYPPTRGPSYGPRAGYVLVLSDSSGREEQVATWQAVPGRRVSFEAATALSLPAIRGVEVRTEGGAAVLRGHL